MDKGEQEDEEEKKKESERKEVPTFLLGPLGPYQWTGQVR